MADTLRATGRPAFGPGDSPKSAGFSLLELMAVVSILSILAAVSVPKFADLIQKSQEAGTMGNLATLRSSLSVYYADNQGAYPRCAAAPNSTILSDTLVPKYVASLEQVKTGLHPPTSNVYCDSVLLPGAVHDGQGWYYDGDDSDSLFGSIYVACDHTDTKGNVWTSY